MSVARSVIRRPVLWFVVFALATVTGFFLSSDLVVEMFPDIEFPALVVVTVYPGADPEIVETAVTSVLEGAIANVGGIQELSSISETQMSIIIVLFAFGTDIDMVANRVRENVDMVSGSLPDDIVAPMIIQIRPNDMPVMRIAVRAAEGSGLTQNDLRAFSVNQLEDRLRQVEGVASISTEGGQDPVIRVDLYQNRLEAFGIKISEISRVLAAQNMNMGAGFIGQGFLEYAIRTTGEFADISDIANTVVMQRGGADIRLLDIGDVFLGFEDERSTVFVDGEPGVYLSVMRQMGANIVDLSDAMYRELALLGPILPGNISLEIVQDSSVEIRTMVSELLDSLVMGLVLAMIVLIIFLRNIKASIIVGLSIPISFVITLLVMSVSGITINMMTLAGLILGLGMTVDCAIVVIESFTSYREKGEKLTMAGILAGEEVMSSLIAATITTLCVFVPIILFRNQLELIGILFQDLVFTIGISVIASLFVGIFLVPVLASKWLPVHSRVQKPLKNPVLAKIDSKVANGIAAITNVYKRILSSALQNRLVTVLFVVCALVGSTLALGRMDIRMMPEEESDTVTLHIEMPIGTRYEETKAVAVAVQDFAIAQINGINSIMTSVGSLGQAIGGTGVNVASITIVLDMDDPNADSETSTREKLRGAFAYFPTANFNFAEAGIGAILGANDIDIMLLIDDLQEGMATAETVRRILETEVPEVQNIAIDMNEGLPQLNINIDRVRADNLGLNVATIAMEIAASMNGVTATTFRQRGSEYDVILRLAPEDRHEIPDLGRIFVRSSNGMLFPVSNFADFERTLGPVTINRANQVRTINITADVVEGASVRTVEARVRELLAEEGIPAIFAGEAEDTEQLMMTFAMVIILALLLVYGVMAAQYESFRDPFINFCTIPLLLIGVVFIHIITGQPITAFTMLGIVLLIGIVTNNGILLVDYTKQLVAKGWRVTDACLEAGVVRFRPVIMTAMSTMLALAPMAFVPGNASSITAPVGLVVFGGLISATAITLVFVPVLYSLFYANKSPAADPELEGEFPEQV
ncbi:MAG: efflux RND transporter permease subunit [Spirochaetes bacterium]|nr:efflux RND transporter permease subunit [Spirochaetota bacterium]